MRKVLTLAMVVLLLTCAALPVFALPDVLEDVFDTMPADFKDPTVIALGDHWVDGATNARHGVRGEFDYIYLKEDGKGDFVVEFEVEEKGVYDFGFTLMGYKNSVLRATNVQVDDGDVYRIEYKYANEHENRPHYFYGMTETLEAGTHKMIFSLPEDFDDSQVKTVYIQDFFYVYEPIAVETTTAAAAAAEPAAPATFDLGIMAIAAAAASLSAAVVLKKRK